MQVESARGDACGVRFELDFSGSTNLLLTPATTGLTSSEATAKGTTFQNLDEGRGKPEAGGIETRARTGRDDGGGNAGKGQEPSGTEEVESPVEGGELSTKAEILEAERGRCVDVMLASGDQVKTLCMSARVFAPPFCRTLVTRVRVRDPDVGGVIKVGVLSTLRRHRRSSERANKME